MTSPSSDQDATIADIDRILAAYLAAVDAGTAEPVGDFLVKHPQHAKELSEFFAQDSLLSQALREPTSRSNDQSPGLNHKEPSWHPSSTRVIGEYEIIEEIARGGMGIVFKAKHRSLGRIVALKVILQGDLASPAELNRFRSEAEAAAHLDHPGIVPIYEIGEHQGLPYYTMAFVPGTSLAAVLRESPLAVEDATRILQLLCEALQHAHERKVIHRDLKPANILLQSEISSGPTSPASTSQLSNRERTQRCTWRPRVTDFGLAKIMTGKTDLTRTGQIVGTPNYMSPEQARGDSNQIGPASDIYSLGTLFYQMLVGHPPFLAENPLLTLKQVMEADPLPLRLLNRNIPKDLEAICLKCLQKLPSQRYATAADLNADLGRFLRGEEVSARSVPLLDRLTNILRQERNEDHFQGWGSTLIAFAVVILVTHIMIFFLERSDVTVWWAYLPLRLAMFGSLLFQLNRARTYSLLPTNAIERLVWAVWVGYLLAIGATNAVRVILAHAHNEVYPIFAILAGLGFIVMGSPVWRGGYYIGATWLLAAPLIAATLPFASLWIGGLWFLSLLAFGLYYRNDSPSLPPTSP